MNKKMTGLEMSDEGYLQEVNRQFFHPLGLAMYVDPETNEMGVFDYRDDLEGVAFNSISINKTQQVMGRALDRFKARNDALGYWIQPAEENNMTVKFNKDGKTVAVLKDSAHEPEGITYLADDEALPEDIEVEMDGVKSLEELDEEAKTE
jgi:hypothetical protein